MEVLMCASAAVWGAMREGCCAVPWPGPLHTSTQVVRNRNSRLVPGL